MEFLHALSLCRARSERDRKLACNVSLAYISDSVKSQMVDKNLFVSVCMTVMYIQVYCR